MGSCCSTPSSKPTPDNSIELQPHHPTNITLTHPSPAITISPAHGHSNVTRPPPPPRLTRLSEIIDPATLNPSSHVRTPSGDLLGREAYVARPDRPRTIAERQQAIRERCLVQQRSLETLAGSVSVGGRSGSGFGGGSHSEGSEVGLLAVAPAVVPGRGAEVGGREVVRVRAGLRGARMVEVRRGTGRAGGREGVVGVLGRWFGGRE
ncbi:hypothetical protein MBLNU230_g0015t1 [Neophaeotheca triangularis]